MPGIKSFTRVALGDREIKPNSFMYQLLAILALEELEVDDNQMSSWKQAAVHAVQPLMYDLQNNKVLKNYGYMLSRIKPTANLVDFKASLLRLAHQFSKDSLDYLDLKQLSHDASYLLSDSSRFLRAAKNWITISSLNKKINDLLPLISKKTKFDLETIDEESKEAYGEMEQHGIKLNKDKVHGIVDKYHKEYQESAKALKDTTGIDIRPEASADVAKYFDAKGIQYPKTKTGAPSITSDFLEEYKDDPVVRLILKGKQASYLRSIAKSLTSKIADGKVKPKYEFKEDLGRVHSSGVNPMNWSSTIKEAVEPHADHYFIEADYSQLELRIAAAMAKDEKMKQSFSSGKDFHTEMAAKVFKLMPQNITREQRSKVKELSIGVLYGKSAVSTAKALGITEEEATKIMSEFKASFPQLNKFLKDTALQGTQFGEVENYFGRKKNLDELRHSDPAKAGRLAVNSVVQNTGGDILRIGTINLKKSLSKIGAKLITTVHDSYLVQVPNDVPKEKAKDLINKALVDDSEDFFDLKVNYKYGLTWANLIPF